MNNNKLEGLFDPRLDLEPGELFVVSGDEALSKLDKLISRITPKRFEEAHYLLQTIRHFGGRCRIVHADDFSLSERLDQWLYCKGAGADCTGSYRGTDHWVSVPIDRHNGWGSVEETLRHELVHLLQDVVTERDRHDEELENHLGLLTDKVRWGSGLATYFRSVYDDLQSDDEPISLSEVEAHTIDTWSKSVRDWAEEVKRNAHLWSHNWYCPV